MLFLIELSVGVSKIMSRLVNRAAGRVGYTIRRILRGRLLIAGVVMSAIYWLGTLATPGTSNLEFEHIARTSVALAVVLAYASIFAAALLSTRPDRVEQLSSGIVLSWVSTVLVSLWALVYRLGGKPAWMLDSDFYGYLIHLQVLGGILHITAPGAVGGGIPRRNWISLGVACGVTLFIFLMIVGFQPDARAVVNFLEHYFRSGSPN